MIQRILSISKAVNQGTLEISCHSVENISSGQDEVEDDPFQQNCVLNGVFVQFLRAWESINLFDTI